MPCYQPLIKSLSLGTLGSTSALLYFPFCMYNALTGQSQCLTPVVVAWRVGNQTLCSSLGEMRSARCVALRRHPTKENDSWLRLTLFWALFALLCSCNGKRIKIKIPGPFLASTWEVNPIGLAEFQIRSLHSAGSSRLVQFAGDVTLPCFLPSSMCCQGTAGPAPPWTRGCI